MAWEIIILLREARASTQARPRGHPRRTMTDSLDRRALASILVPIDWVPLGSRGTPSPGRSAAASQVDRSQHAPMLYALLGVSGVALVLLVAPVFVLRIRKAS